MVSFSAFALIVGLANLIQPAFTALNLEPEENIDDEIDTTRELHVSLSNRRFARNAYLLLTPWMNRWTTP